MVGVVKMRACKGTVLPVSLGMMLGRSRSPGDGKGRPRLNAQKGARRRVLSSTINVNIQMKVIISTGEATRPRCGQKVSRKERPF